MSNTGLGLAFLLYLIWYWRTGRFSLISEAMSGKQVIQ